MKLGWIVGGLVAFALYKYSKLNEEQKRKMVNSVKEKGKKLYDDYVPDNLKDKLAKA